MRRVLIVGGEAPLPALLADALSARVREFAVDSASTIAEAIERLASDVFDILPAGLLGPGGDGVNLRQWTGAPHRPEAARMTGLATAEERQRRPRHAAEVYERQFDPEKLVGKHVAPGATGEDWN